MSKTEFLSCRVDLGTFRAVNAAAESEGVDRSEWLKAAISRALDKRPHHSIKSRVAKLEQRMKDLEGRCSLLTHPKIGGSAHKQSPE